MYSVYSMLGSGNRTMNPHPHETLKILNDEGGASKEMSRIQA